MKNKLKQKFLQFMQGRYGADELSKTISWTALAVYFAGLIADNQFVVSVATVALIYNIYRMFSKDYWARSAENRKYLDFVKLNKMRFEQRKTHKIFACKSCGKNIRIPRGKGKIEVRCPKCGNRSIHRT